MARARILVVEDEGIIAEDLRMGLEEMGYDVVAVVSTGEDAVREAEEKHPDLVLMDVVLHGDMDGIEAADRIHVNLDIPVIYLTAYSDEKILERAKVAEPFGYMIKPIRERDLYSTIEMALFKHEMQKRLRESHEKLESYSYSLEEMVRARTQDLENSRKELKKYSESLEKTNEALKLIIQGIEAQKRDIEEKIAQNLNLTVTPIIDQLKSQDLPDTAQFLLKSLEFNVSNIASTFGVKMNKEGHRLTPKELRICDMIRSGLSSKQIAKIIGTSPQTVLVHRKNIRKKLGLANAKKNLASYLKSNL